MSSAWGLLVVAFAAAYVPRGLGAAIAGRIDPEMAIFDWFGCVAYALVGGLMVRVIFFAPNPLAAVSLGDRAIAVGVGIVVFLLRGRSPIAGTMAGIVVFAGLALWRTGGL